MSEIIYSSYGAVITCLDESLDNLKRSMDEFRCEADLVGMENLVIGPIAMMNGDNYVGILPNGGTTFGFVNQRMTKIQMKFDEMVRKYGGYLVVNTFGEINPRSHIILVEGENEQINR